MPYIQVEQHQYSLHVGDTTVGTAADAGIRLAGPDALGIQAILSVSPSNQVAIRRASPNAIVRVNGVQLGAEPSPLIHGDKVDVAGHELRYGDERRGGGTQVISGLSIPEELRRSGEASPAKPTAATGGRVVSLVDGREYPIGGGLSIGRDAACDVVVPGTEVSRRHAEIAAGHEGYVVTDLSTNGVFVNGERIARSRVLGRADVVRIGNEEFRFYADVPAPQVEGGKARPAAPPDVAPSVAAAIKEAPPAPRAPATPNVPVGGTPTPRVVPPAPAPVAGGAAPPAAPSAAPGAAAAAARAAIRPVLATLEILNAGIHKGKSYEIRTPLAHVGRGEHNDVVIPDDSVSDSHAKLQRRESGWVIVDMGSTNGTYVGGKRVAGEAPLEGAPDLRFGGIKMAFRPQSTVVDDAKGTRAITGVNIADARRLSDPVRPKTPPAMGTEPPAAEEGAKIPGWIWVLLLVLIAAAVFFVLQGQ